MMEQNMRKGKIPEGRSEKTAVFMSTDVLAMIKRADVIRGRDEETGNEFIVFGLATSKAIIESGQPKDCNVLQVELLQRTRELEALCISVRAMKRYDEYRDGDN
jgi:hypothetical protein